MSMEQDRATTPQAVAVIEAAKAYYASGGDVDDHNELMDAVQRLHLVTALGAATCSRCKVAPSTGVCCSSHNTLLCHYCYRRTHFVEICVEGCRLCAGEGLDVRLP